MSTVVLRLFVTGHTPRSERAIEDARGFCAYRLGGRAKLDVVDVLEQPDQAEEQRIIATPTLVQLLPTPERRIIGDLPGPDEIAALLSAPPGGVNVLSPHVQAVEKLDLLTPNERYAMIERVMKGRQAKEVAEELHVSGPRVAQLVAAAQRKTRAAWGWVPGATGRHA